MATNRKDDSGDDSSFKKFFTSDNHPANERPRSLPRHQPPQFLAPVLRDYELMRCILLVIFDHQETLTVRRGVVVMS